jgi:hypothetical protein
MQKQTSGKSGSNFELKLICTPLHFYFLTLPAQTTCPYLARLGNTDYWKMLLRIMRMNKLTQIHGLA